MMFSGLVLSLVTLIAMSGAQELRPLPDTPSLVSEVEDGREAPIKNASYWVTYSSKMRPGQEFPVTVQILDGPVTVTISLLDHTDTPIYQGSMEFNNGDTKTITFEIGHDIEAPPSRKPFQVAAVGKRGDDVVFEDKGTLTFDSKSFSMFVQTTKAQYKPSQNVYVRALAVYPDLTVIRGQPWSINVKDVDDNVVWQRNNLTDAETGVIEFSFLLPDRVPAGEWTITAKLLGAEEEKKILVENYVLPKFDVEVDVPSYAVTSDRQLSITVKAKYSFGKPVADGMLTLVVGPSYHACAWNFDSCRLDSSIDQLLSWNVELNAKGEFTVSPSTEDLLEMIQSVYEYWNSPTLSGQSFFIRAEVMETNTRRTQVAHEYVRFHRTPFQLSFPAVSPTVFKPGLNYTGYIEVTKVDGSSLSSTERQRLKVKLVAYFTVRNEPEPKGDKESGEDATGPAIVPDLSDVARTSIVGPDVIIEPGTGGTPSSLNRLDLTLEIDDNGWVKLQFAVPEDTEMITIEAWLEHFRSHTMNRHYLYRALSPSDSYLQLTVPEGTHRVGDSPVLTVNTTEDIKELHYQVYAKGMLVDSQSMSADPAKSEWTFSVDLTQVMAPTVKVVAMYIREGNSEFVVDSVTLNVDGLFKDPLRLSYGKESVKPGENVKLTVSQDVGSDHPAYVFVLVNDISVQLLKDGYDITQEMVIQEMMSYGYNFWFGPIGWASLWRGWAPAGNGRAAYDVFESAGVKVLTDGYIYKEFKDQWFDKHFPEMVEDDRVAGAVPEASPDTDPSNRGPTAAGVQEPQRIRSNFQETWLWKMKKISVTETSVVFDGQAPDTITTWVATAFSVHPTLGLNLAAQPAKVTTFQPLSVHLDLPYDITRREEFCFTASVFNYHPQPVPVLLTLAQSEDYSPVLVRFDGTELNVDTLRGSFSHLKGLVMPNEVKSEMFCLKPERTGVVPVKVSALTVDGISDAVQRDIIVKPEGNPQNTAFSYLIPIGEERTTDVSKLSQYVAGSQYITVQVVGNLLGPLVEGIDGLLRRPYGCGEQNMLNFAPNVFLLDYYFKRDEMTPQILEKGKRFMQIGYIKAITYEHGQSGGYSTFGNDDNTKEKPSLWLSAFILKCFSQSVKLNDYEDVITIDPAILNRTIEFVLSQQIHKDSEKEENENGHFVERGKVFNKNMKGGAAFSKEENVTLTAYTVIALHEALQVADVDLAAKIRDSIKLADSFLTSRLSSLSDTYAVCLTAYALNLINSQAKNEAFEKMEASATEEDNMLFWRRPRPDDSVWYWWQFREDAISVEATAYALLTHLLRGTDNYLSIVRWMITQRGPNSGFHSTQDTVVGLQALTALPSILFENHGLPYTVTVSFMDDNSETQEESITITENNQLMINRVEIPYNHEASSPTAVTVSAAAAGDGTGSSVYAEVVLGFNELEGSDSDFFEMNHRVKESDSQLVLTVTIRTTSDETASMCLLSVDIPANFVPDTDLRSAQISMVEVKEGRLFLYFNSEVIGPRWTRVNISMTKIQGTAVPVVDKKFIKIQLYYEPGIQKSIDFNLQGEGGYCSKATQNYSVCPYYRPQSEEE